MARIEIPSADYAPLGAGVESNALFQIGMRHAAAATPNDRVAAHKWFNIAAMQGNEKAAQLRREIAEEMSPSEIAAAQRAARNWITHH